jgi:uncharacterized damage-inducible protein DinB
MNKEDLIRSWEYDQWATWKLIDAAAGITPAGLEKDLGSSFKSVYGTLVHIYGAQFVWLSRWKGSSPKALITKDDIPSLGGLRERWEQLYQDIRTYIYTLPVEDLQKSLAYQDMKGNPWSEDLHLQIQHVLFHSMYHRGQIVTLLRQLGQVPPQTDFIAYLRQGSSKV